MAFWSDCCRAGYRWRNIDGRGFYVCSKCGQECSISEWDPKKDK